MDPTSPRKQIPAQVSGSLAREGVTLNHAKSWLRVRVEDGEHCPCCGQFAKVYKRRVHQTIAKSLIALYKIAEDTGDDWVHVPTKISPACEVGKARYWDLVQELPEAREDGGRAGWWRLTETGFLFVRGIVTIPTHARIYDGRCLGFEGPQINIADCLGNRFNYGELMKGYS